MTGGTGFVGRTLTGEFIQNGHEVTVLTRAIREEYPSRKGVSYLEGNPAERGKWQERVAEHEVIVNLAGASIFGRWTKSAKKAIRDSRILTTQNLIDALVASKGKERLFITASAVGYYGFHGDEELDEGSGPGDDFLASLAHEWESTALKAEAIGEKVVILRFGIVLGRDGGALKKMIPPFKWSMGSPLGSGRQWFSWIHEQDLAAIYLYLLERKEFSGPINCTAPEPVRNEEMVKALGEVLGKPTFMPAVPGFMIKAVMGEFGSVLLKGQKVLPKRLLSMGFRFRFSEIRGALEDLLAS
jgi:uncharacterized protein (TIGR01777 family)